MSRIGCDQQEPDRAAKPQPLPPPPAGAAAATPPLAPPSLDAEFDLEGLRAQLDEQGLAVATAQEASVRSRKALADRTKGGKGVPPWCRLRGGWGGGPG